MLFVVRGNTCVHQVGKISHVHTNNLDYKARIVGEVCGNTGVRQVGRISHVHTNNLDCKALRIFEVCCNTCGR